MYIVRSDKRNSCSLGYPGKAFVDHSLPVDSVFLKLKIEIPPPEQPVELYRILLRRFKITVKNMPRNISGKTGGKRDKPLGMLRKKLIINSRLSVEALGESL